MLNLPIIGGMATMPSREENLKEVLPEILNQVDFLYIYLDKYEYIPTFLHEFPKIKIIENLNLGCTGKFKGLDLYDKDCIYFGFDDDIIYPNNYVDHLLKCLDNYNYKAVVGVHGSIIKKPFNSYVKDRLVYHFEYQLDESTFVDILGCGTCAFHSDLFKPNINSWTIKNMDDLHVMKECIEQNIKRVCISRPEKFLNCINGTSIQADSIWQETLINDGKQTKFIQEIINNYPLSFLNISS